MKKMFVVLGVVLMFCGLGMTADVEVPNPVKELFDWTMAQSIGATYIYDIDDGVNHIGGVWNIFRSRHDWLYAGLCASGDPSLGFSISFNAGKLLEKIKGSPLVYLKHLEIGYTIQFQDINDLSKKYDGLVINAIKFEF